MKRSFRRLSSSLLALALLCALCIPAHALNISVSNMKVEVDGYYQAIEAYLIDGNNYFKLRDIAALMDYQFLCRFEISFSPETRTVDVFTGGIYTPVGGELSRGGKANPQVQKSDWILNVNGVRVDCSAYLIDGSNYYKLRDLGDVIGFDVDYDSATRTVQIIAPPAENDLGLMRVAPKMEYDAQGRLVRETDRYLDGTTYLYDDYKTYSYDASGKITTCSNYLSDGTHLGDNRYTYDASGKLTSIVYYYSDMTLGGQRLYTYNAKGQLSTITYKDVAGELWCTETYYYNASGKLERQTSSYPDELAIQDIRYFYENGRISKAEVYYDSYLVGIQLYDYDANGNLLGISERTSDGVASYPLTFVQFGG